MKITFLAPLVSQGGGSRVLATYALGLRERGHEVTVVSRGRQPKSLKRQIYDKLRGKSEWLDPDYKSFFNPLGRDHVEILHNRILEPKDVPDADLVVATWWRTAFEAASLPVSKGKKAYFIQHHEVFKHLQWDLSQGSYYLPLHKITIARWLVDAMAEFYGDHDVDLVPNGVDLDHFLTPSRPKNDVPTVGLMNSMVTFKGTDSCIAAIERLRRDIPNLRVVAFGMDDPGPLPAGTEYHRYPAQEKIPEIYASCDAWLFGSRDEGFGLPLLESMACRTPLVATRAGAAPDLIEDGKNGFLVDIDDVEAMAARLSDLVTQSASDWQTMSDAAYATAQQHGWEASINAFEAALVKAAKAPLA